MTTAVTSRIRRALLYLQPFDARKVNKAATHPTLDCACLNMEDGVALSKKDDARAGAIRALENVDFGRTERLVRINSFDTGDLAKRDLDAVLSSRVLPDGIVIPKVESPTDIQIVSERLDELGDEAHDVRIVGMIESANAMLRTSEICAAQEEEMKSIHSSGQRQRQRQRRLDALIFGADDYASDIGATRTKAAEEMNFARNYFLLQASAYKVQCIDMVQTDYHDVDYLKHESILSFQLGFVGRQVIHPKQIDPVQEAYSPTLESIEHAAAVVRGHKQHESEGAGAFEFEGKMIDMPLVKQYELLLDRARQMGLYAVE